VIQHKVVRRSAARFCQYPSLSIIAGMSSAIGSELLTSGVHSDLTLKCQGKEWQLHKAIVLMLSGYLMGAANFDQPSNIISIDQEKPEYLDTVIKWMYTGEYKPPRSDAASNSHEIANGKVDARYKTTTLLMLS
jgi:hypothetical protein